MNGLDYSLKVIKKHPEWVKQAHDLGLKVNVWTVNKEEGYAGDARPGRGFHHDEQSRRAESADRQVNGGYFSPERFPRRWGISSGGLVQNRIFMSRNILITGGAGFIGSHVVRLFVTKYPDYRIVNLDKLTYAGNLANLKDIEQAENYRFERCDICDYEQVLAIFPQVPNRRRDPSGRRVARRPFDQGSLYLRAHQRHGYARCCRRPGSAGTAIGRGNFLPYLDRRGLRRIAVRRHALYGDDQIRSAFALLRHRKASSDHFVRAFHDTYGMPTLVTNCSNNYGPYQFPEKTDSAVHQQYPPRKAAARLRQG